MYSTIDDLKTAMFEQTLIQLTDDELNKPSVIDPEDEDCTLIIERINKAISAADSEIDGYCATKYSVPFEAVPPLVNTLSVDIAIYHLHKRKTLLPEDVVTAYDKAISRLKDISRGLLTLGLDPPPAPSTAADSAATNKTVSDRVFTRDSMRDF